MNAAARAIHQSNLFSGQLSTIKLSKELQLVLSLLFAILLSAIAVIYITNEHRVYFMQCEELEQNYHQLKLQRGQLLLEQASLAASARVERLAAEKLEMILPADKNSFVLKIK